MTDFSFQPALEYYKIPVSYQFGSQDMGWMRIDNPGNQVYTPCGCPQCLNIMRPSGGTEIQASTEELIHATEQVMDQLERRGWTRGACRDEVGRVCLVQAANNVQLTSSEHPWFREFAQFLGLEKVSNNEDFWCGALVNWNDKKGRTFDEVMAKLRDFMYELKSR